jgi:hypothetical protein
MLKNLFARLQWKQEKKANDLEAYKESDGKKLEDLDK